jgi:hypothetical protein
MKEERDSLEVERRTVFEKEKKRIKSHKDTIQNN